MVDHTQIESNIYALSSVYVSWPIPYSNARIIDYVITYCEAEILTGSCVSADNKILVTSSFSNLNGRISTLIHDVPLNSLIGLYIRAHNGVGQGDIPNERYYLNTATIGNSIMYGYSHFC